MISEELKKFAEKNIPNFKVTDATTEIEVESAFGDAFVLKTLSEAEIGKAKVGGILKAETTLKKFIGDSAKGKTLEEMITTILPDHFKSKEDRILELEAELKSTGKTTDDYEKLNKEVVQLKADLEKANKEVIPELIAKVDELTGAPEKALKEYQTKQKVDDIYFNNPNWIETADDDKKNGVFHRKIKDKVVPKMDDDGEIYACEPDGETYMKDGMGKKKFSTFVEEVLKSDDVKAFKENGSVQKKHLDNSKPDVSLDKKEAHKTLMQDIADKQRVSAK